MKTITTFGLAILILLLTLGGCGGSASKKLPSAEEQFSIAKKQYDKKRYYSAIEDFQKVIFSYPGATIVDTAQYYLALSYLGNQEYEVAAVEFRRLSNNYPLSNFVDEADYMAGVCLVKSSPKHYALDQENLKSGIRVLEDFIIDNPDSPLAKDARQMINESNLKLARKEYENGLLYYKIYDLNAAMVYFQFVVDNYTDTEYAAMAFYKLCLIAHKKAEYETALAKFTSFVEIYPNDAMVPEARKYIDELTKRLLISNAENES
ncbi:MAG: outer membrane protein assembly factor BamD [Candidatus Zixiibacteriota bacterium]